MEMYRGSILRFSHLLIRRSIKGISAILATLREEIFAGMDFRKFIFGHFAGINFRKFGFTEDFAGINFHESSSTKDSAGINFRESALFKVFAGVNLSFAISVIVNTFLLKQMTK